MAVHGKNYVFDDIGPLANLVHHDYRGVPGKLFIGGNLGLTGCEVSLNCLPSGRGMPFIHAHRKNEELYIVLRGSGVFYVDGKEFPVTEGSLIRVAPDGARGLAAGAEDLYFICIQAEENSLTQATQEDGYRVDVRASWIEN